MAALSPEAGLELLRSGAFSDLTIQCKDRKFKVHRAIICPQSTYFQKICVSKLKERSECRVNLPNENPDFVNLVLVYLYTKMCDLEVGVRDGKESRKALLHVGVYACADKFEISGLKTLVCKQFMAVFRNVADKDIARLLRVAYGNTATGDNELRAAATRYGNFPDIVEMLKRHEPLAGAIIQSYANKLTTAIKDRERVKASLVSAEKERDGLRQEWKHAQDKSRRYQAAVEKGDERLKHKEEELAMRDREYKVLRDFVEEPGNRCRVCCKQLDKIRVTRDGKGGIVVKCEYCQKDHYFR